MRFAHISDLHLCLDAAARDEIPDDVVGFAEEIAADLLRLEEQIDFIVISGDLTEDAAPQSFAEFERLFSPLSVPIFTVPGNHDGPAGYHACRKKSGFLAKADLSERETRIGDCRLIGFDTCIEGSPTGRLTEEDLARAAEALAAPISPLLIVMHHAPFTTGQATFDGITKIEGGSAFGKIVRGAAAPPVILCGHVHRPYVARWNGATCFVGGSPMGPFGGDLPFGDYPLNPTGEHYEYFLHAIENETHVVTPRVPEGLRGRITMPASAPSGPEPQARPQRSEDI